MKILKTIFLLSIFTCSGCAAYWYNEDRTYQQASTACWDFLYQVQKQASDNALQQSEDFSELSQDAMPSMQMLFEQCMKERGYNKTSDLKLEYYIRKGQIEYKNKLYYIAGK